MLTLILGKAGTGKTAHIIHKISENIQSAIGGNILLVPEQYTHEAERELLRTCGDTTSLFAEVLSFSRLALSVSQQCGDASRKYIDKGGRLLQMTLALEKVAGALSVYGNVRRQPEAILPLISAIDELRSSGGDTETLRLAAQKAEGGLAAKLRDLTLLQEALAAEEEHYGGSLLSRIETLAEQIPSCASLRGCHVFVDGFSDFTSQEQRVIRALWRVGDVTLCLNCEDIDDKSAVSSIARHTAMLLRDFAAEDRIECRIQKISSEEEISPLSILADHLFEYSSEQFDAQNRIHLYSATNITAECEMAAAETLRLMREDNCRRRDIAIAVRGFDTYRGALESAFDYYGIPLYTSTKSDVLSKPMSSLIRAAYAVILNGWRCEDVLSYLKSGLTGLSRQECDELENYALLWDLNGRAWTGEAKWHQHPEGFGGTYTEYTELTLERLNRLRERVVLPLKHLAEKGNNETAADHCRALAEFWEEIHLANTLRRSAEGLNTYGMKKSAEESLQLYEKAVEALEQYAAVLGSTPQPQKTFSTLYLMMLSQYSIGTIPVGVDRVIAGDFDRMRRRRIKHLLILGATDGNIPFVKESSGVFTGYEREIMQRELDIDIETDDDALRREFTTIYSVLTLPSSSLYISRPLLDGEGRQTRSCFVTNQAQRLFGLTEESGNVLAARATIARGVFDLAASGNSEAAEWIAADDEKQQKLQRLLTVADLKRGRLSPHAVSSLYGEKTTLTASRTDMLASCAFRYFMGYGLKAKTRQQAGFDAPTQGTFLHAVLEEVAREAGKRGGVKLLSNEEIKELTNAAVEHYIHTELQDFAEKSERFIFLFRRLCESAHAIVLDMVEELRSSDFVPLDFELSFSNKAGGDGNAVLPVTLGENGELLITGIADRVDGWEHDGKLYLRVMDYKTGGKNFEYKNIYAGKDLQMLLYLFALQKNGKERYGKEVVPAGVMYIPAKEHRVNADRNLTGDELAKERNSAHKRKGLLLADETVLNAMEHNGETSYIPCRFSNPKGTHYGDYLAEGVQLQQLSEYIDELLLSMEAEMRKGVVDANPWQEGDKLVSCQYCEYRSACHFDPAVDKTRTQQSMKAEAFWSGISDSTIPETEEEN